MIKILFRLFGILYIKKILKLYFILLPRETLQNLLFINRLKMFRRIFWIVPSLRTTA